MAVATAMEVAPDVATDFDEDETSDDIVYSPEEDESGNVYWRPVTTRDLIIEIAHTKVGKTYTTEEVWQNLEREFGIKLST